MSEGNRFSPDQLDVVHGLRAPLGVAGGYLSMLRDGMFGPPPDRWDAPLGVLAVKLEEARILVDDLLELSRIDLRIDSVPTTIETVDLVDAAHISAHRAEPRALLLRSTVVVESAGAPVIAAGEKRRTLRILDNLINNALLHAGEQRQVIVRVDSDDGPQVAVEDSGPGVPEHLREHLFEPFVRDQTSGHAGTGLGLYLSRALAREMGGDVALGARRADRWGGVILRLPAPPYTTVLI